MARWLAILEDQGTLIVGDDIKRTRLAPLLFVQHEVPQNAAKGLSKFSGVNISTVDP